MFRNLFWTLWDKVWAVLINNLAGIVDYTLKEMEKDKEVLVIVNLGLLFACFDFVLHLKELSAYVFEGGDICSYSSYAFIHLNNLFKHKFFLSLFHQRHNFRAIQNKILLMLHFQIFGLFQVVYFNFNQFYLLQNIFELSFIQIFWSHILLKNKK